MKREREMELSAERESRERDQVSRLQEAKSSLLKQQAVQEQFSRYAESSKKSEDLASRTNSRLEMIKNAPPTIHEVINSKAT